MTIEEAFWKIHSDLPRQAPGSDETTLHLYELAGRPIGKGLEIGCGQGRASTLLARAGVELLAIDTHQAFIDELKASANMQGLDDRITAINMSMDALNFPESSFDLIWCEAAVYILGWKKALEEWKRLLKPNGVLVVTECCWLTDKPSKEAKHYWEEAYPAMMTVDQARQIAEQSNYNVIASYIMPDSDWWTEYYTLLKAKYPVLQIDADKGMKTALKISAKEVEIREKYGNEYGYVGFVLRARE